MGESWHKFCNKIMSKGGDSSDKIKRNVLGWEQNFFAPWEGKKDERRKG